ncbi:MAG: hypothetical protein K0U72_04980 [Gammaproteobacteria bacterium]|nr:hypothetical protein [Gammaproteobacteria bacterium]
MTTKARGLLALVAAAFILPTSSVFAAKGNSADLLSYIPEDTPYVFAATKPLPKGLADKMEPAVEEMLDAMRTVMRNAMADELVKMSEAEEEGSEEAAAAFRTTMEQFIGMLNLETLREAGIQNDSAFVFYGNGIVPVIRVELSDEGGFDKLVSTLEANATDKLKVGEVNGQSYKYAGDEKARVIIATIDEQAIITLVPTAFDDAQLSVALGLKKPGKSLKKSRAFRAMKKEYDLLDSFAGYIDLERIASTFVNGPTGLDKDLLAAFEFETPVESEVCTQEFMSLARIAPRVVMGYTKVSADAIDSIAVVEVREDIAKGMSMLTALVPGLGIDPGGFMSFGMSLNPMAARTFYESRLDALEADPYECPQLADFQAGVAKGRAALEQPIPPVVYGFRGFVANIMDMDGIDFASDAPPESIEASVLISIENAESLVMMAAMMDPEIAGLNLVPDGKAVKIENAELAAIAKEAFAALSTDAVSLSFGEGSGSIAEGMLLADSSDPAPFMSISLDAQRYYALIGEAMMQDESDSDGTPMPLAAREAMRDAMTATGSLYDRMSVDVRFTERGVEIDSRTTLAD